MGQKNGLFAIDTNLTFRARSHEEMLEWWNDCKQLSKVYCEYFSFLSLFCFYFE